MAEGIMAEGNKHGGAEGSTVGLRGAQRSMAGPRGAALRVQSTAVLRGARPRGAWRG